MWVLYVEDDVTVAETVQLMLQGEGYSCDTIRSGVRAVALAKRKAYDLILLDVMLPDIDGYEVMNRVREAGVRTPFLILTGLASDHKHQGELPLGVSEFLEKPFNKNDLIAHIQSVVARAGDAPEQKPETPAAQPDAGEAPQTADEDGEDERRQHRRFETTTPAKILHGDGVDCIILNMSYGGAKLQLADPEGEIPQEFELQVENGSTYRCIVSWRFQDKVGVRAATLKPEAFLDTPSDEAGAAPDQADKDDNAAHTATEPQSAMDEGGAPDPATSGPADEADAPPAEQPPVVNEPGAPEPAPVVAAGEADVPLPEQPPVVNEPSAPEPVPADATNEADAPAAPAEPQPAMAEPGAPAHETAPPAPPAAPQPAMEQAPPMVAAPLPPEAAEPPKRTEATGTELKPKAGDQVFVVDQGVSLDAESCECRELLVKGRFRGSVRADRLQLVEGGQVIGSAEVAVAEISGAFDGDLIVAQKLVIRATGSVSGRAQYNEIIIEPGGRIAGQIQSASNGSTTAPNAGAA